MEKLEVQTIQRYLKDRGTDVYVFEQIDSTNNEAKRAAPAGTAVFAADMQTAGRGRLGRSFYSPAGTGVYFTIATHLPDGADMLLSTPAAAVAAMRAVRTVTGIQTGIKWVNDLYLGGKKVCGILTEARGNCVYAGIGININTECFPDGLDRTAASLGRDGISRCCLIAEVTNEFLDICGRLPDKSFMEEYRSFSILIGKEISYVSDGIEQTAVAEDIDEDGGLVVRGRDGVRVLRTGEVSVRLSGGR